MQRQSVRKGKVPVGKGGNCPACGMRCSLGACIPSMARLMGHLVGQVEKFSPGDAQGFFNRILLVIYIYVLSPGVTES